jgi:hypothetical protein
MLRADQHNHEISIVEVSGTQKSADLLWDNSKITSAALPTCSTAKACSTAITTTSTLIKEAQMNSQIGERIHLSRVRSYPLVVCSWLELHA